MHSTPATPHYERLGFRTLRKLEVWDRAAGAALARAGAAMSHRQWDMELQL